LVRGKFRFSQGGWAQRRVHQWRIRGSGEKKAPDCRTGSFGVEVSLCNWTKPPSPGWATGHWHWGLESIPEGFAGRVTLIGGGSFKTRHPRQAVFPPHPAGFGTNFGFVAMLAVFTGSLILINRGAIPQKQSKSFPRLTFPISTIPRIFLRF